VGDIRHSSEMLPVLDRACSKLRCGRPERATTVDGLFPRTCKRLLSDQANAAEGVACFQIAKEE
jgi:hypothetical protein